MDYEEMILARQEDDSNFDECSDCDLVDMCRNGNNVECPYTQEA